ncbi:MAG: ParB/RepB/Spo0J family partition protein, partial [Reyranella sp.]
IMSQSPKLRGLGRGLSALLGDEEVAATVTAPPSAPEPPAPEPANSAPSSRPPLTLPIGHLKPGKMQPRTTFEDIEVLVESVKEFGLLQPILVRPVAGTSDSYEIVAGERRWRAAQKAQLHDVPVVVRPMGDQDALQLGLIENLQRADLTAIDEALAYRRLQQDFDQSHEDIARTVGKSRPHVANTVRLLELPDPVQEMVRDGRLSAGQARALIGVPDPLAMAQRALDEELTVRALEHLGGTLKRKTKGGAPKPEAPKSADTRALEKRIEEALGLKAELKLRGLGEQSLLTLEIRDFDQLDAVVDRLTRR